MVRAGASSPRSVTLAGSRSEPALLAANTVVADVLEQCATIGELQHALSAGLLDARTSTRSWPRWSRDQARQADPNEITVFDSTGSAFEDVAAAADTSGARARAGYPIQLAD
jgi:ornithine cyclodeaminase/alanine dehydrogenase-like protein (mu-crystallin family)